MWKAFDSPIYHFIYFPQSEDWNLGGSTSASHSVENFPPLSSYPKLERRFELSQHRRINLPDP